MIVECSRLFNLMILVDQSIARLLLQTCKICSRSIHEDSILKERGVVGWLVGWLWAGLCKLLLLIRGSAKLCKTWVSAMRKMIIALHLL